MKRTMWARIACVSVVVLGAACVHRPPPPLHSTALIVEHSEGAAVAFVHVKIAGESFPMLLDTGAARSVLPAQFAVRHKLFHGYRYIDDEMIDVNGRAATMALLSNVPVQFEGESAGGTMDFLMNPSGMSDFGLLVPQDIVRPGWALVIDFGRAELRYEREEEAVKRLGADPSAPLRELKFSTCLSEGFFERGRRVVSASVNGVQVSMLLDTGASRTLLARNNPAIQSMLASKGRIGASVGVVSEGRALAVNDIPVVVSQTSYVMRVFVHPQSQTCGQGLLGADVLQHCTLVWGWNALWLACRTAVDR